MHSRHSGSLEGRDRAAISSYSPTLRGDPPLQPSPQCEQWQPALILAFTAGVTPARAGSTPPDRGSESSTGKGRSGCKANGKSKDRITPIRQKDLAGSWLHAPLLQAALSFLHLSRPLAVAPNRGYRIEEPGPGPFWNFAPMRIQLDGHVEEALRRSHARSLRSPGFLLEDLAL